MAIQVNRLFFEHWIVSQFASDGLVKKYMELFISRSFLIEFEKILFLFLADFKAVKHQIHHSDLDLYINNIR